MPQLRIARADTPTDPVERAHVAFSAAELKGGKLDDWFIGRDRACRMCIADPSVSRRHLQIVYQGGVFHLRTVSQFGSEIDGRRLSMSDPPVPVRKSLSVKVGTIELRCTFLDDADDVEPVVEPPSMEAGSEWWSSGQPSWSDPLAAVEQAPGLEIASVPSAADWGASNKAGVPHFGNELSARPPKNEFFGSVASARAEPASDSSESLDWTKDLHAAPAAFSGVAPAVPAAAPTGAPQGSGDAASVVAQILQSAGLRADIAALHAKDCTPEEIGALLSQLLSGMIATLATRRTVKNTLRVAHTEVQVEGNNPLKHAVTATEALIALVQGDRAGYLGAEQSIQGVFKDLSNHELAVIDGVEAALKHVVNLMSPESVERASSAPESNPVLGGKRSREARLWAQYRVRFAELLGGGHAFSNHFLPAFREAYDACLTGLRRRKA